MNTALSDNIRAFRKAKSLTQEQLAAALGVTVGAVYKWEAKLSTPDINLIIELADLFDTSVDVLLGYEAKNNKRSALITRLKDFLQNKDERGLLEADKSLIRYPNCFDIVYQSAILYKQIGFMKRDNKLSQRSIELLERACLLIGQNDDPEISELSIYKKIAEAYSGMGEYEKAVELFINNNPCGINDDAIGFILGTDCDRPDEAIPFLSMALLHNLESLTRVIIGYFNVYFKKEDFTAATDILALGLHLFSDLKKPDQSSSLDKTSTFFHVNLAAIQIELGDIDAARRSLCMAKTIADEFDRMPNYNVDRIRFVSTNRPATSYDDMGATAIECIRNLIKSFGNETLSELWEKLNAEKSNL